ncbi:MAG: DUF3048 domain-containing protein [Firmicutes bacterium]|nr:DUF3048 domain-containing protein [Bacillota bacterium]
MFRGRKCIVFLLLFALFTVLFAVGCRGGIPKEEDLQQSEEGETDEEPLGEQTGYRAPLTGEWVEEEAFTQRRPLAIIIDNDPTFGTQSGLDKAAWVFEIPVEGGITRFLAIYQHLDAPILGPVRSVRPYFLDRALEFEAALGHIGYSPQAKKDISKLGAISLNEFTFPNLYWRTPDKKMPHNLYTNTEGLFAELAERGLDKINPSWELEFRAEDAWDELPGGRAQKIRIHYHLGVVEYRYSSTDGVYKRFFRDQPHLDAETGEQLSASNIIIQHIERPRVLDAEGRLEFKSLARGQVRVLQAGKGYEALWEKNSRAGWTRLFHQNGNLVDLVVGNTWVQVVPEGIRVEVE